MTAPRLAIFGVTGRMGQSLMQVLLESTPPDFVLAAAVASDASRRLGADAAEQGRPSGVTVTADARQALEGAAVAIDFSVATAAGEHAALCAAAGVPLLVGATGVGPDVLTQLQSAARRIPLLLAPNTSIGAGVLLQLVRDAVAALGESFDVEVSETHHRAKRDAPSGTALALGEAAAAARGEKLPEVAVYDRHHLHAARVPGSIGFSVVRAGDIIGEHTVTLAGQGERIELTHRATDRRIFARGALRGAAWLIGKPAGLYGMQDMLGRVRSMDSGAEHR